MRVHCLRATKVAQYFGTSVPTVWRWSQTRTGFPQQIMSGPNSTRWRVVELEAWVAAQEAATPG